jgi:hypothetical protein
VVSEQAAVSGIGPESCRHLHAAPRHALLDLSSRSQANNDSIVGIVAAKIEGEAQRHDGHLQAVLCAQ